MGVARLALVMRLLTWGIQDRDWVMVTPRNLACLLVCTTFPPIRTQKSPRLWTSLVKTMRTVFSADSQTRWTSCMSEYGLWTVEIVPARGVGGSFLPGQSAQMARSSAYRDMLRPGLPTLCMSRSIMLKSVGTTTLPWATPMSRAWDFKFESPTFTAIRLESRNVCTNLYNRPVMPRACILSRSLVCQTVSKALLMPKKVATVVRPSLGLFLKTCSENLTTCSMQFRPFRKPAWHTGRKPCFSRRYSSLFLISLSYTLGIAITNRPSKRPALFQTLRMSGRTRKVSLSSTLWTGGSSDRRWDLPL